VAVAYPRLPLTPPSERQLAQRKKFALAVLQTRQWLLNKARRHFLEGLARKWESLSPYHAGVKYLMLNKEEDAESEAKVQQVSHTIGPAQTSQSLPKPVPAAGSTPADTKKQPPS